MSKRCKWCHQVSEPPAKTKVINPAEHEGRLNDLERQMRSLEGAIDDLRELVNGAQTYNAEADDYQWKKPDSPDTIAIANVARAAREKK